MNSRSIIIPHVEFSEEEISALPKEYQEEARNVTIKSQKSAIMDLAYTKDWSRILFKISEYIGEPEDLRDIFEIAMAQRILGLKKAGLYDLDSLKLIGDVFKKMDINLNDAGQYKTMVKDLMENTLPGSGFPYIEGSGLISKALNIDLGVCKYWVRQAIEKSEEKGLSYDTFIARRAIGNIPKKYLEWCDNCLLKGEIDLIRASIVYEGFSCQYDIGEIRKKMANENSLGKLPKIAKKVVKEIKRDKRTSGSGAL